MGAGNAEPGKPAAGRAKAGAKGPRPKHVPQRMCIACRGHDAKRGLHRIVRTPEGPVELDPTGRRNGRGAYLCGDPACWERALGTGLLGRALKTEIQPHTVAALRHYAQSIPTPAATDGEEDQRP